MDLRQQTPLFNCHSYLQGFPARARFRQDLCDYCCGILSVISQYNHSLKVWQARKNIKQLWPIELPSSIAMKPLNVCPCHTETIWLYCKHEAQVKSRKWNSPSRIFFFLIPGLWRWWYGWRVEHKGTGSSHCWHCHPWDPQQTDRKTRRY